MTARRWLLLALSLGAAATAAYAYGRYSCPPPDWYVRVFVPSGNWACVQ